MEIRSFEGCLSPFDKFLDEAKHALETLPKAPEGWSWKEKEIMTTNHFDGNSYVKIYWILSEEKE